MIQRPALDDLASHHSRRRRAVLHRSGRNPEWGGQQRAAHFQHPRRFLPVRRDGRRLAEECGQLYPEALRERMEGGQAGGVLALPL
jgi:hypothetical protein